MDKFENEVEKKDENKAQSENCDKHENGVRYYSNGRFSDDAVSENIRKPSKKMPTWVKALIIIVAVFGGLTLLTTSCNHGLEKIAGSFTTSQDSVKADFDHDYIGTIYVEGQMSSDYTGVYDQQHLLDSIDAMIEDKHNKGMIIYVDTPGGEVFAIDQLYSKIKEYQKTGRPVYASMQSMAASGGYYISAPCDKIFADRNCWTGSIGVIMGNMVDVSGLMDKLGIKVTSITSGKNKGMGGEFEPMTDEQREIFQSMIDEAYDQFVGIVADGRNMDEAKVRKLADGRIYTAKQALEAGLVDKIGTFDDAVADMQKKYKLQDCSIESFEAEESTDLLSLLGEAKEGSLSGAVDMDMIRELISMNGKVKLCYMSEISK